GPLCSSMVNHCSTHHGAEQIDHLAGILSDRVAVWDRSKKDDEYEDPTHDNLWLPFVSCWARARFGLKRHSSLRWVVVVRRIQPTSIWATHLKHSKPTTGIDLDQVATKLRNLSKVLGAQNI